MKRLTDLLPASLVMKRRHDSDVSASIRYGISGGLRHGVLDPV